MQVEFLATPAQRRRLKVRERILSAAEDVFAQEGSDGLSIRRLAKDIDYSPAAIYKYFGSKDELLFELNETFFAKILHQVHGVADCTAPYGERIRACVAGYIRIAVEKPHHYSAAFSGQLCDTGSCKRDGGFEGSNKGLAFLVLKSIVQEGIDTGALRSDIDASVAAKSIWCSTHGLAMMFIYIPDFPVLEPDIDAMPGDAFIDWHADTIVRGLEGKA